MSFLCSHLLKKRKNKSSHSLNYSRPIHCSLSCCSLSHCGRIYCSLGCCSLSNRSRTDCGFTNSNPNAVIGCPFHPDDAPPSAPPAGERPCRPEEGAVGTDAALRKGHLAAQQAGWAEEAAAAATAAADAPVPRSPGSLTGDFGRSGGETPTATCSVLFYLPNF